MGRLAVRTGTGALAPIALLSVLCSLPSEASRAAEPVRRVLERTIPLPDVSGRIDHMAADLRRGRLFVAELGNGSVDVVDIASDKVVHRIAGLREPQGVGYLPGADLLAVANAGDRLLARVRTRSGARTSLFVPELDRLFVAARAGLLGTDAVLLVFRPAP